MLFCSTDLMIGIAGFDIFLSTVEYWLRRQKLGKYATDGPDIDGL